MAGAAVYLRAGRSAPFAGLPLPAGPGPGWHQAPEGLELWDDAAPVTLHDGGREIAPSEVCWLPGRIRLDGPAGTVVASGRFYPVAHIADADGWKLTASHMPPARTMGDDARGHASALAGATVRLTGVRASAADLDADPAPALIVLRIRERGPRYLALTVIRPSVLHGGALTLPVEAGELAYADS